jgi:hypothetical protein
VNGCFSETGGSFSEIGGCFSEMGGCFSEIGGCFLVRWVDVLVKLAAVVNFLVR